MQGHLCGSIAVLLIATTSCAHAINKCVGRDSSVIYQEAPCPDGMIASQSLKTANDRPKRVAEWSFARASDSMTGRTVCGLRSPAVSIFISGPSGSSKIVHVLATVIVDSGDDVVLFSTESEGDTLHSDVRGTGVKLEPGTFFPFTERAGLQTVGVSSDSQIKLVSAMQAASSIRLRLRFWPYDRLYDTEAMTLAGFETSLAKARSCAGRVAR